MQTSQIVMTLFFIVAATLYCFAMQRLFKTIFIPGIKSGKLKTNIGIVSIEEKPLLFMFFVCFWLFAGLIALVLPYCAAALSIDTAKLLGVI
jgi:hypothetical protein